MVIGGDAAGMSAASQARRLKGPDELEIVAFERSRWTSYSACGIPYWVSGDVKHRDDLIARTPEEHRERDIDLRMRTEVTEIDVAGQRVRALDRESGEAYWTGFDKLVIATGARPVRPALPGIDAPGVHGVQTLGDGQALLDSLDALDPGRRRRAVVVGAGYIGVEMAEAMLQHGFEVTVLNRGKQPMATLDPDMGALVHEAMDGLGITTVNGAAVTAILTGPDGRVSEVATEERSYPADVVVLGIGVEPEAGLARAAGLAVGPHGGILTDLAMRAAGHENIWAGGDCVEVLDLVAGRTRHIALGTHANKHGQVIGSNVGGGLRDVPGGRRYGGEQGLRPGDRPDRPAGEGRPRGGAALRHGDHRVDAAGGVLPGGEADDGEDDRGAPYGPAARGADRGPRGVREAGGRGGGGADGRDDGGADDGARPRLRPAVLAGLGPGASGGPQDGGGGAGRGELRPVPGAGSGAGAGRRPDARDTGS
ncbi:NADPH-dependent 2,4-dienoyl-CoA reductase, sulfur reductase [Streptomyces sp. AmelKG-D3]|nr:NADPH-dependent 2,4-dienoyl-CoA reductase, sulfur reductase [Streptomyces sp. AmelKG-D3]